MSLEGSFGSNARLRRDPVDDETRELVSPGMTGIALVFQGTLDGVVGPTDGERIEPLSASMPDAGIVALLLEHQSYTQLERVDDSLHHGAGAYLVESSGRPVLFGPEIEPPTLARYDAVVGDIDGDGNDEVLLEREEMRDSVNEPNIRTTTWDFLFHDTREIMVFELGVVQRAAAVSSGQ